MNPTGRAGLIVPSGIATDDTTKAFFADIVNARELVSLYDFENGRIFPGVHRSYEFCLLTLSGADRPAAQSEFAFFMRDAAQISEPRRKFALTRDDFAMFNPNTRTCPIFRTRRDMEIARKMYQRAGVFWREAKHGAEERNPWGVEFSQMFNMTTNSDLFRTREYLEAQGYRLQGNVFVKDDERYLPLYEAKLFHQYDHRFATFEGVSETQRRHGNARPMPAQHKADADAVVIPRYWVAEKEVAKRLDKSTYHSNATQRNRPPRRLGPQIVLRRFARPTDNRTEIAALMPTFALVDTGIIIMIGSSYSETYQAHQTDELQSQQLYEYPL